MTRSQIVILGLGGQGILFVTRVLAEAAIAEGWEVITAETHGMAQRGGAVESHVKFGGYAGPLVRAGRADATIVIDRSRAEAARALLKAGGACVVNEGAATRGANVALLGRACAEAPGVFPPAATVLRTLERLSPPAALEANRRAFEKGAAR